MSRKSDIHHTNILAVGDAVTNAISSSSGSLSSMSRVTSSSSYCSILSLVPIRPISDSGLEPSLDSVLPSESYAPQERGEDSAELSRCGRFAGKRSEQEGERNLHQSLTHHLEAEQTSIHYPTSQDNGVVIVSLDHHGMNSRRS